MKDDQGDRRFGGQWLQYAPQYAPVLVFHPARPFFSHPLVRAANEALYRRYTPLVLIAGAEMSFPAGMDALRGDT
jgi:hypothetical protein